MITKRDLLYVDITTIIHNGKVVAHGTPANLIQNIDAKMLISVIHSK